MRFNKLNGILVIMALMVGFSSGASLDNMYVDLKFGATFEGSSRYDVYDTSQFDIWQAWGGNTFPYLSDATLGYVFSTSGISLFTVQQFSFDNPDPDESLVSYSAFLGSGKFFKVYYALWHLYGLVGYSLDKIRFKSASSTVITTGYPAFHIGSDLYLKFLPFADLVLTYRFGITTAKEVTTYNNYYDCKYKAANYKNDFAIGVCFGKTCTMH
jgi:hypothetical protein